jgi:hypothetical protein
VNPAEERRTPAKIGPRLDHVYRILAEHAKQASLTELLRDDAKARGHPFNPHERLAADDTRKGCLKRWAKHRVNIRTTRPHEREEVAEARKAGGRSPTGMRTGRHAERCSSIEQQPHRRDRFRC